MQIHAWEREELHREEEGGSQGPAFLWRWGGLRQGSDHRPWEKPAAAVGALALSLGSRVDSLPQPCTSGEQGDGVGSAAPWSQAGR